MLRPWYQIGEHFILGATDVLIHLTKQPRWKFYTIVAVAYFATAYWLKVSYVPMSSQGGPNVAGVKIMLHPPFREFLDSKFAVISNDAGFSTIADTADNITRSDIMIYEDDKPLGPAHSTHADVGKIGLGRFSHWRFNYPMFLFSSSDNTDPRTNGRTYWAVRPDPVQTSNVPR